MNLAKIQAVIGVDVSEEMDGLKDDDLKAVVINGISAMREVEEELENNQAYQQAKQAVSDLSAGKKGVFKMQKAKIAYALYVLESRGVKFYNPVKLDRPAEE